MVGNKNRLNVGGGGGGWWWWWWVVVVGVEGENRNKLGACQYYLECHIVINLLVYNWQQ